MQLVVGCKVEGMEEKIGQPVKCWFCSKIVHCNPSVRPQCDCESYEPLGRYITHQHIADWLNIERHQLSWILKKYGADKIVELLEVRGHIVRYEAEQNLKFFWIGEAK